MEEDWPWNQIILWTKGSLREEKSSERKRELRVYVWIATEQEEEEERFEERLLEIEEILEF